MPFIDSVPIFSQVKSAWQAITGDMEAARDTQVRFAQTTLVVSQVYSLVQAIAGDYAGAEETQLSFVGHVSKVVDAIPVVGHVKGGIHHLAGDEAGALRAYKSSSRSTGATGGALVGLVTAGPVGAYAGALAGGACVDVLVTSIDSAVQGEHRPFGLCRQVEDLCREPTVANAADTALTFLWPERNLGADEPDSPAARAVQPPPPAAAAPVAPAAPAVPSDPAPAAAAAAPAVAADGAGEDEDSPLIDPLCNDHHLDRRMNPCGHLICAQCAARLHPRVCPYDRREARPIKHRSLTAE